MEHYTDEQYNVCWDWDYIVQLVCVPVDLSQTAGVQPAMKGGSRLSLQQHDLDSHRNKRLRWD